MQLTSIPIYAKKRFIIESLLIHFKVRIVFQFIFQIEFIDENVFDEDDDKAEEKKSLKEKLQTVQEISTVVLLNAC